MVFFAMFLALIWGILWAVFLQEHSLGRFLAIRRTWITVVVGIGGDLLIGLLVLEMRSWMLITAVIVFSSVGIIARSLYNELGDERGILDELKKGSGEQEIGQ